MINSRYFFSASILIALASGAHEPTTRSLLSSQHNDSHNSGDMSRQHAEQLETLTKVIGLLRENREIKCNPEDKILVNRLLESISDALPVSKKLAVEDRNCEVARKLRTIVQIYGFSSEALDNAQGCSSREETTAIIYALQKCLAERGISSFHRNVRNIVNTLEPYKTALVITALPFLGYMAYRLNNMMQDCFVSALELNVAGGAANKSSGAGPSKTSSSCVSESWKLFSQALIIPAAGIMYKYLDTTIFKNALEKATDAVKKLWAKLQALPFSGSNPASNSKVSLKDVPASPALRDHLTALARMTIAQEDVYKQQGGAGLKTLLIHGDTSLIQLLAFGLADEIVRLSRESGNEVICPVAVVHASKFTKTSFKDTLEKITTYNKACVIVIQDLDWTTDGDKYSTIVAEIIGGIKSATKLHEQYIVIGTARNIANVDVALQQSSVFGTRLMVSPAHDHALLQACIERAEHVYGLSITQGALRTQLESYICNHSFGDFMNLFAAAYTKALPQVCGRALDEHAIVRELALVQPATYALVN